MTIGNGMRMFAAALLVMVVWLPGVQAEESHGTAEEAQIMVGQAVAYFDEVGARKAFTKFSDDPAPMFLKGDLYVFVIDGNGTIVAHGVDPSLIGRDATQLEDVDGKKFGQEMLSEASMDGTWVDYKWKDPLTDAIEPKSSWVVLHDGYVFGVGIYKP